jgi:2'-5' RNA ligase
VGEGAEGLCALAHAVEACLQPEGFAPEDRPFVPHITLGRASRPKPFEPADATLPELRFTVSRVDLVQSKHGTTGVAYSTLASYHF